MERKWYVMIVMKFDSIVFGRERHCSMLRKYCKFGSSLGPHPDFKKMELSDESQLSEPSFPALAGTAQVSAVGCRSNIHLRLQGIQFWEWIHDYRDSTTSTGQILWTLWNLSHPPSNLEADQQQRLDTRWRHCHKKTQKPHCHVKGCQGYNLLRPGSGLEWLAKSKGLSSPRLPSTQEEFATGIHSPFKNFQSSLWIGSLKIQYHFIVRTSYVCLCSHPLATFT